MILLIDIGNTRIKWAPLQERNLGDQSAAVYADWSRDDLKRAIVRGEKPKRVVVGNVGGKKIGDLLSDTVRDAWGVEAEFIHATAHAAGVRNAYPEPAKLGVDRWLAMIGVHAIETRPACIVSVGTAMTIDGLDGSGQHLGGLIVPGPDLMVSSLLRNTSDIATRAEQGSVRDGIFADNTLGGVQQGAVQALAALIERAVESMRVEVGQTPAVFVTGGASQRLEALLNLPHESMHDLVLRGLATLVTVSAP